MVKEWIGVDLDGTLAEYNGWKSSTHIGKPIPLMVKRVKDWLKDGKVVKIFTARVDDEKNRDETEAAIRIWCRRNLGQALPITNVKNQGMIELWDDRAYRVEKNTGKCLSEEPETKE